MKGEGRLLEVGTQDLGSVGVGRRGLQTPDEREESLGADGDSWWTAPS